MRVFPEYLYYDCIYMQNLQFMYSILTSHVKFHNFATSTFWPKMYILDMTNPAKMYILARTPIFSAKQSLYVVLNLMDEMTFR